MVSTSSSETASFYHDHRFPLSHQFSLPLPVLCVTTQEDIWLFSVSYQSPRPCLWGYTQAHLPEHFGKLLQYPRNYLRNTPSPWATRWKVGPYRSLQSSMRSVPASSRFTSCHPPPTSTLHLYSNLLVPWRHHISSCLKTFAHAVSSAPKVPSLSFCSPSSS